MNKDDMNFIVWTERFRYLSQLFVLISLITLIAYWLNGMGLIVELKMSNTVPITTAILAATFRLIAIDRFFRMGRQMDKNN
ncbi:MAG: hypothetical protein QM484_08680 [Woeseiaceae bacterium]